MKKNEQCYTLRCEGLTNSEIASIVGCKTSQVPTFAKGYRDSHGLPHWSEVAPAIVAEAVQPAEVAPSNIERLAAALALIESLEDSVDLVEITLIKSIARVSSGIIRSKK